LQDVANRFQIDAYIFFVIIELQPNREWMLGCCTGFVFKNDQDREAACLECKCLVFLYHNRTSLSVIAGKGCCWAKLDIESRNSIVLIVTHWWQRDYEIISSQLSLSQFDVFECLREVGRIKDSSHVDHEPVWIWRIHTWLRLSHWQSETVLLCTPSIGLYGHHLGDRVKFDKAWENYLLCCLKAIDCCEQ
jgi:hypothetical protein